LKNHPWSYFYEFQMIYLHIKKGRWNNHYECLEFQSLHKAFQIFCFTFPHKTKSNILLPKSFIIKASYYGAHEPSKTKSTMWTISFNGLSSLYSIFVRFCCKRITLKHTIGVPLPLRYTTTFPYLLMFKVIAHRLRNIKWN